MVRAIFPNLVATELVSVQPMTGPSSLIFYLQFVYGQTKGGTKAGTTLFDYPDKDYAGEKVPEEQIGTGNDTATPAVSVLSYRPVRPGSLTIKAILSGVETFLIDNNNGGLVNRATGAAIAQTINYASGTFSAALNWGAAVDDGTAILATYEYDSEGSETIPQIDLLLQSTPVHAQPKKLRSRYSMEAAANLKLVHGIDAEMELSAVLAEELNVGLLSQETGMKKAA